MSVLAFLGIFGAICWLLTARKPVINLEVFRDRNFAMGCALIGAVGMILYATTVLIPQFTQQELGYTALLSSLILAPGSAVVVVLIPVVKRLMNVVETRYLVMVGFLIMGVALMYSSRLVPYIDYTTMVKMRSAMMAGLGFLFVPISTIAFLTLPQRYRSDGAALFSMFRNVGGAVGISIVTALVVERRQADQAHLAAFMTPLQGGYEALIQRSEATLLSLGRAPGSIHAEAVAHAYKVYELQAAVLAYNNASNIPPPCPSPWCRCASSFRRRMPRAAAERDDKPGRSRGAGRDYGLFTTPLVPSVMRGSFSDLPADGAGSAPR